MSLLWTVRAGSTVDATGPNNAARRRWLIGQSLPPSGSKIHVLSDRVGVPLSVAVSAANTNDADALKPLVWAYPRSGPDEDRRH
jgi:hypothetical protein